MIVWGGWWLNGEVGGQSGTGGRYNPVTNAWNATSLVGAAAPRFKHTAVWTGSEMIVWGGWSEVVLNTGGRYNPLACP